MPALFGLLLGALIGHWVWPQWGAIVGGLLGFFGGATMASQRARNTFRQPVPSAASASIAAPAIDLEARIAALERRIAQLEAGTTAREDGVNVSGPAMSRDVGAAPARPSAST